MQYPPETFCWSKIKDVRFLEIIFTVKYKRINTSFIFNPNNHSKFFFAWKYSMLLTLWRKMFKWWCIWPGNILPKEWQNRCIRPGNFLFKTRDRSKFTRYLGQVLGKLVWKKVFVSPFLVEKKVFAPLIFPKKNSSPPFFISSKRSHRYSYENEFMYLLYASYANQHTRVTWPNIAYLST